MTDHEIDNDDVLDDQKQDDVDSSNADQNIPELDMNNVSFLACVSKKSFLKSIETMRKLFSQGDADHVVVTADQHGILFRQFDSDNHGKAKACVMMFFNKEYFDHYRFPRTRAIKFGISLKQLFDKIKPFATDHIRMFSWWLQTDTLQMWFSGSNPNGKETKAYMYIDGQLFRDYFIAAQLIEHHAIIDVSSKWLGSAIKNACNNSRMISICYDPVKKLVYVAGDTEDVGSCQKHALKEEELIRHPSKVNQPRLTEILSVRLSSEDAARYIHAFRVRKVVRLYLHNTNEILMSFLLDLHSNDLAHPSRMDVWFANQRRVRNDQIEDTQSSVVFGLTSSARNTASALNTFACESPSKSNSNMTLQSCNTESKSNQSNAGTGGDDHAMSDVDGDQNRSILKQQQSLKQQADLFAGLSDDDDL